MIVAKSHIKLVARGIVKSENQMPEQIAHKFILFHKLRMRVVAVLELVVRQMPFCQAMGCYRHTKRTAFERLRVAQLHIPRQTVVMILETLHLTAKILHNRRQRKILVGIVIIYTQVGSNGKRIILLIV